MSSYLNRRGSRFYGDTAPVDLIRRTPGHCAAPSGVDFDGGKPQSDDARSRQGVRRRICTDQAHAKNWITTC